MTAFISPFRKGRKNVRDLMPPEDFVEIHVSCPISVCEERDKKGLYKQARRGEILEFTGISSPYEKPDNPELEIHTDKQTLEESVTLILNFLKERNVLIKSDH